MPRTIRKKPKKVQKKKPKKVQKKFKKVQRKKKPRKKSLTKEQKIGIALGSIGGAALLGTGGYLGSRYLEFNKLVNATEKYIRRREKMKKNWFPQNKWPKESAYEKSKGIKKFVKNYEKYKKDSNKDVFEPEEIRLVNELEKREAKTEEKAEERAHLREYRQAKAKAKAKAKADEKVDAKLVKLQEEENKEFWKLFKEQQNKKFGKKNKKSLKSMVKSPAFIAGVTGTAATLGGLFALNEKWYSDYVKKRKKRNWLQRKFSPGGKITPYEKFMGYRKRYKKSKKKFGKKVSKKPSTSLRKLCKKYKVRLTVKRKGKRVYKSEKVLKKQCKNAMKRKK
tara:strand:+ start:2018 stop:3028 length:1011 start_codon:yes stop_codon:yes gene_type:complete